MLNTLNAPSFANSASVMYCLGDTTLTCGISKSHFNGCLATIIVSILYGLILEPRLLFCPCNSQLILHTFVQTRPAFRAPLICHIYQKCAAWHFLFRCASLLDVKQKRPHKRRSSPSKNSAAGAIICFLPKCSPWAEFFCLGSRIRFLCSCRRSYPRSNTMSRLFRELFRGGLP